MASWAIGLLPGWASAAGIARAVCVSAAVPADVLAAVPVWVDRAPGLARAVVAAIGVEVLKLLAIHWLPGVIAKSQGIYGSIGIVFGIFAWLLIFGKVIVYASVLQRGLEERRTGKGRHVGERAPDRRPNR
ncbi:MAG: hypothetical protein IPH38_08475 [Candidatus Microthrix sp.]|nr:hypothetical protein [Candidatus Microthrix sp.]MBK7019614.1 hypothetical protein [Candidatus Microthrix sp.]